MNNQDQARPSFLYFLLAYLLCIMLLSLRMPPIGDLVWIAGNDDAMRLVQVRDFMAGQGFNDLMQYRLGLEGGTLMHWSRLIDLPIAALIWIFSTFLPANSAEIATMIVWPLGLAGLLLWIMQRASIRFGGKRAEIAGLGFSMIAVLASGKFGAGSLDHHNVQLVVVAVTLWAMVANNPGVRSGAIAGAVSAFGVAIGLEAGLFIAALSLFVGLKWVWVGKSAQNETVGFSAAFGGGLLAAILITQPDFTRTLLRCDALGFDVVLLGFVGTFGLLAISLSCSRLAILWRGICILGLGIAIILVARLFAPACLANPMDQLYPDVLKYWLGNISEAKPLITSIKSNAQDIGLLFVPIVALLYLAILGSDPALRSRAIFLALVIAAFLAMTLYQIRGVYFMLLLCALPISAMLGMLYERYKSTGLSRAGLYVIVALLASIPDVWAGAYSMIGGGVQSKNVAIISDIKNIKDDGGTSQCFSPKAVHALKGLPKGLVVSSPNMGAGLLNVTKHHVLRSNFHRNQDGIQAGLDMAFADINTAKDMLSQWGAGYLVYCQNDQKFMIAGDDDDGLWPRVFRGDLPDFLTRVSDSPDDMLQIFEITP